ncbi:MAG: single-stranded DNA-binding protein [Clostridiales bacterium]|nr:single-stranded DNA-binding protein [Clostridiales bacterium]
MAVVTGKLESSKWEDDDGNKRTSWRVNADRVY